MSADADHEVIDSPDALFRHLYEAHGVEEALDLDPETAPVQFWLRRHADLEREARLARRAADPDRATPPAPPAPEHGAPAVGRQPEPRHPEADRGAPAHGRQPGPEHGAPGAPRQPAPAAGGQRLEQPGPGREGRRPAAFGDPLVEAFARALAGRGHGEAAVRGAIRGYASPASGRTGEAAVRGDLIEPMLRAAADRLLGGAQPPAGRPAPAERQPQAAEPARSAPRARPEGYGEPRRGGPVERPEAPAPGESGGGAEASPPEAAWAVFWADLADTGTRRGAGGSGGDDDDLMAIADAVQRRRRRRPAEREPRSLRR